MLRIFTQKLEKWSDRHKHLLSTIGLFIAVLAFVYSAYNTRLTYLALRFAYRTYEEENIPLFEFEILRNQNNLDYESITVRPKNENLTLNSVSLYFIKNELKDTFDIMVPREYNLYDLKNDIAEELKLYYCDDCYNYSDYAFVPVVAKFACFRFGKEYNLLGLFQMTCKVSLYGNKLETSIRNFEFVKYYDNSNDTLFWGDIEKYSYNNGYKYSLLEDYVRNRKIEVLNSDNQYRQIVKFCILFEDYGEFYGSAEGDTCKHTYQILDFLTDDSLISAYKSYLYTPNPILLNIQLKNKEVALNYSLFISYLKKIELPKDNTIESILNSKWVNDEVLDSVDYYYNNLSESLLNTQKFTF